MAIEAPIRVLAVSGEKVRKRAVICIMLALDVLAGCMLACRNLAVRTDELVSFGVGAALRWHR